MVAAIILVGVANFTLLIVELFFGQHVPFDWNAYAEAGRRFGGTGLYEWTGNYSFRYAPVAAPLLGFLTSFGVSAWRVVQLLATLALPSRVLTLLVLVSYPFYFDINTGNLMIFVAVAAVWALKGHRVATGGYLALTLLIPRPLMLPAAAWILWKRPQWRLPFLGMMILITVTVLTSGYATAWIGALVASRADIASAFNFGPTAFVGAAWLIIGVPLSCWLTYKGHLGWASLSLSPYLLPYYFLMLILEWPGIRPATSRPDPRVSLPEPAVA